MVMALKPTVIVGQARLDAPARSSYQRHVGLIRVRMREAASTKVPPTVCAHLAHQASGVNSLTQRLAHLVHVIMVVLATKRIMSTATVLKARLGGHVK